MLTTGKEWVLGKYTTLSLTAGAASKFDSARGGLGLSSTIDTSGVVVVEATASTDVATDAPPIGVLEPDGDKGIETSAVFLEVFFLGAQNMDVKASSLPARDFWIGAVGLLALCTSVEAREPVERGTDKSDPME